jgi:streptogramin lyase
MIAVVLATIATLGAVTPAKNLISKQASVSSTGGGGVSHSKSHLPSGTTKFFALPNNLLPSSIVGGPDGNVWFTALSTSTGTSDIVGYVTPSGTIHQFSIPQSAGFPTGSMAVGPDKALWFTLAFNGQPESTSIGRITTAGSFQAYQTPEGLGTYGNIHIVCGLTAGPDGNMWFSEQYTNNIGRMSPSGSVTEFNDPSADGFPTSITAGPDGNLWFSDKDGIGKMTPSGGTTLYPFSNGAPCLSGGPGGKVWFTDSNGNVDSISSGGQITTVATGVGYGCVTTDSDGNLWFFGNGIERISSSGAAKSYPISGRTDTPQCLTVGPDGNIWFITQTQDGLSGSIGYVAP